MMTENATLINESVGVPETTTAQPAKQRTNPLANFNLRLLWLGESVSLLGDQFTLVALPWLVLQLTGSAVAVGTILAVAGIPRALFMLIGGVLTDRLSPRRLMLISNASRIVIAGLLTLLVVTDTVQLWMLYVMSLAFGVVDAFFHPAYMAMIPTIVEEDELAASNAILQGTAVLVTAGGPGIGGALVKLVGIGFSFLLDTLSFAFATIMLLLMKPVEAAKRVEKAQPASIMSEIREGLAYILKDDLVRPFIVITMAINFLFTAPLTVGPSLMAKVRFAEGAVALGVLLSAFGVGSLLGLLAAGGLKPSRLGVVTLCTVAAAGVCMIGAGYAGSLWLTAVLFAAIGASSGFSNLLLITWFQRRVSKEVLGRVMSIAMLSSVGLMPISSALGGFIAEYNLSLLYALCGSLLVLVVVLSLLNRNVRTMRA
jgi:MFS family permease